MIKFIMAVVYLLKSLKDFNNYIGSTSDLTRRINEHHNGFVKSTKNRRPLVLIGIREIILLGEARLLEHKYKRSHDKLKQDIKKGLFKIIDNKNIGL